MCKYMFSLKSRKEKVSIKKLKMLLLQVTNHNCGKTYSPFSKIIGIPYRKRLSKD